MSCEVALWKLNTNSEQASGKDNTHDFKGESIDVRRPRTWIENVCDMWSHKDTESRAKNYFAYVELDRG